jgi:decaprenylphospho-beta-D-ribofuranose 2-oxidase
MNPLDQHRVERVSGFGRSLHGDMYVARPQTLDEVREVLEFARRSGRKIMLKGAGRSYGDAAIANEEIALDLSAFGAIDLDPATGIVAAGAGATLGDIWKRCLPHGYWLPVVSGTMFPTMGGALAMNIHGKNAYKAGTLGDHIENLTVLKTTGEVVEVRPGDPAFRRIVSSAGLGGIIFSAHLRMKRVVSGKLSVTERVCRNWDEQFQAFEEFESESDYMVSWLDAFKGGKGDGRGVFHAANHLAQADPSSLMPEAQALPARIMGVVPKSEVWRVLQWFNNRAGMRGLNSAKHHAAALFGKRRPYEQTLAEFSFLLDYVPNWQLAYGKEGFLQHQLFVPVPAARSLFPRFFQMQRETRLETYLAVMKRHKPDEFLFSHGVDGYSLAMDFKLTKTNRAQVVRLCQQMTDVAIEVGGKAYFAKDATLTAEQARAMWPDGAKELGGLRAEFDPGHLLFSQLGARLGLL